MALLCYTGAGPCHYFSLAAGVMVAMYRRLGRSPSLLSVCFLRFQQEASSLLVQSTAPCSLWLAACSHPAEGIVLSSPCLSFPAPQLHPKPVAWSSQGSQTTLHHLWATATPTRSENQSWGGNSPPSPLRPLALWLSPGSLAELPCIPSLPGRQEASCRNAGKLAGGRCQRETLPFNSTLR